MTELIALGLLVAAFCWVVWMTHGVRPPTDDVDSRDAALAIWQQRADALKKRQGELTTAEFDTEMDRIRAGVLADSEGRQNRRSQGPALAGLA